MWSCVGEVLFDASGMSAIYSSPMQLIFKDIILRRTPSDVNSSEENFLHQVGGVLVLLCNRWGQYRWAQSHVNRRDPGTLTERTDRTVGESLRQYMGRGERRHGGFLY
jgi:hypothetical protein